MQRARAATDAYRIELLQAKLGERELDVQGLQESLASLEEENTGACTPGCWQLHGMENPSAQQAHPTRGTRRHALACMLMEIRTPDPPAGRPCWCPQAHS